MTPPKPTDERRERDRAATRSRIVDTALGVLEGEGAAALTMRRIAADMEYTAPIVYQHFANKDALVRELVEHGHRVLVADLEGAQVEGDPDERLLHAAVEYVRFAGRHPHLYAAMNGTLLDAGQRRAAAEPAYLLLQDLLRAWSESRGVDLHDGSDACDIVWGILHGMASLGRLDTFSDERAQRLASEALRTVLRGWRSEGPRAAGS
jgi:AcrR family transcriptional regulator